jgi:hypothetical protein
MIAPPVPDVELRDWKEFEPAVANGYEAAMTAIEENWSALAPIAAASKSD